ncbi:hypothetical protein ACFWEH_12845 [Streptomyces anulatus]|uniref:hypothetical protein n=1 Tax=Streptomyces TaxID=1883 RepID=UPI00093A800C|nr:hypothetical protein [Streptomyces sp. TSRI0395]OKI83761.1 hypothetical protein AMK12_11570 [Streptomyces sp. TSRI0395]
MPTPGDQVPGGTTELSRRLAVLEREVRELRAARRLQNAAIGAGGLRIVDGGRFLMETPGGSRMVDIGAISNSDYDHGDGTDQQAIWLRREDGTVFFGCFSYPPSGSEVQAWTFYDRSGTNVLSEDTVSGTGLARPWLPMNPPTSMDSSQWPRSTSAGFSTIATAWNTKWQPRLRVFGVTAAVGTATGEVQLVLNGSTWGPVWSAGAPIDYTDTIDAPLGGQFQLEVQARRLTGSGSIAAQILMMHSRQT